MNSLDHPELHHTKECVFPLLLNWPQQDLLQDRGQKAPSLMQTYPCYLKILRVLSSLA